MSNQSDLETEVEHLRERLRELEFNVAGALLSLARSHVDEDYLRHIAHLVVYGKDDDRREVRPTSTTFTHRVRTAVMGRLKDKAKDLPEPVKAEPPTKNLLKTVGFWNMGGEVPPKK